MPTKKYPNEKSPYAIRSYNKGKFEVLKGSKVVATMKNEKMAKMYIDEHLKKDMPDDMGDKKQMGAMPQKNMSMGAMPNSPAMKPSSSKYQ